MPKHNKKEHAMDIVFLLDRSGSMGGIEEDTIGGYNSYLNNQKGKNVLITTILFDDQYEMLNNREKIENVEKLTNKTYFVRGSTALLDAVGKTIHYLDSKKPSKVLFVITTDGMENASKEYSKESIKELIQKHNNWEFMYIGANIDSYSEGTSIGIKSKNIANYEKSSCGVGRLFSAVGKAACEMYDHDEISNNWKSSLLK